MSRLVYRDAAKMAFRRSATPDQLAVNDRLLTASCMAVARRFEDAGSINDAMLDYITHRRKALKAAYFRQRYGRDYWTGEARRSRPR